MSDLTPFDEQAASYLTDWGQRLSRRGVLARVAKMTMKIAGIALVPLLPADRAYAQFSCASDYQTCGMHGFFCKACCGGGNSYASCPSCTTQDGAWSKCCPNNSSCPVTCSSILYYDCCATPGDVPSIACQGDECPPGGGGGTTAYCQGGRSFRCTIVVNMGSCSIPGVC